MTIANPYTEQAIANYNDNPPPNDGTQVAANLVDWDKIKDELGDPIKTLSENIDDAINSAFSTLIGKIGFQVLNKAANYTILPGDVDENLILTADTSGGDVEITLPTAANYTGSEIIVVKTSASNTLTVKDSGAATVATITANQSYYRTISDGTNEYEVPSDNKVVQEQRDSTETAANTTLAIPNDDTVPAIGEGADTGLSVAITPTASTNRLKVTFNALFTRGAGVNDGSVAIFQDSTCVWAGRVIDSSQGALIAAVIDVAAGGTTAQTWTVRFGVGSGSGTVYFLSTGGTENYGSANKAFLNVQEIKA